MHGKIASVAAFQLHASSRLAGIGSLELDTLACTARQGVRQLRFHTFKRRQRFWKPGNGFRSGLLRSIH